MSLVSTVVFSQQDSTTYDWNPAIKGAGPVRALEFSYHANNDFDIRSHSDHFGQGSGTIDLNRIFKTQVRFPIFFGHRLKIAGGFSYSDEEFHFDENSTPDYPLYQVLNNRNLKSIGGSVYLITQLKQHRYLMLRMGGKLRGDYWKEHIGNVSKYTFLKYEIMSVIGWKINSNKSWGVGLAYSYSFGDPLIFPIFTYAHSFAPNWCIKAFLPAKIELKHRLTDLCYVNAKAKLKGGSYSIHFTEVENEDCKSLELRRSDINLSLELEKGITCWLWLALDAGYRANLNFDATKEARKIGFTKKGFYHVENTIDSYAKSGLFFNVSLFVTPSKKLLENLGLR